MINEISKAEKTVCETCLGQSAEAKTAGQDRRNVEIRIKSRKAVDKSRGLLSE